MLSCCQQTAPSYNSILNKCDASDLRHRSRLGDFGQIRRTDFPEQSRSHKRQLIYLFSSSNWESFLPFRSHPFPIKAIAFRVFSLTINWAQEHRYTSEPTDVSGTSLSPLYTGH